ASSLLFHGLFVFGLLKITSHSFKPNRNFLILYSTCMCVYSVTIALCDISMASSPRVVVMISLGVVRGLLGLGIYLGIMSIILVVLLTLPIYRYSAMRRNWFYLHVTSMHAIAPYCALTAMAGLLIYCLPAFFFKPEQAGVEVAAPLIKQKFALTRDYGYMAMIGYYGDSSEARWKPCVGLAVEYLFFICFYIAAIVVTYKIYKEALNRDRSKKRRFLERRHLISFWTQAVLITVLDQLPRAIWSILPLFSLASDIPHEISKYSNPVLPLLSALSIIYTVPELYIHIMKSRGKPVAPSMDQGTTNT
ncbi:hypothetical protein PMAYCL1PPCAC_15602, partial [Pristionchus mayeri]